MRNDGIYSECGTGNGDGSITQTQGSGTGTGGTERGGKRNVDETPWFNPVDECKDGFCPMPAPKLFVAKPKVDLVNHPPHYNAGRFEAIDVIEDAVQHAPNSVLGALQWQALKYLLRMWTKGNTLEDAKKSMWYLSRLIAKLENAQETNANSSRVEKAL